uniref:Uncharacterized protein n=1 Tax=Pipistrellus kuhlii TaxID=59472 RepID=A0A7J7R793_PIPKU|nr:hypothetical protein mPipKuh1_010839 [Pipistrellus kuhlii]
MNLWEGGVAIAAVLTGLLDGSALWLRVNQGKRFHRSVKLTAGGTGGWLWLVPRPPAFLRLKSQDHLSKTRLSWNRALDGSAFSALTIASPFPFTVKVSLSALHGHSPVPTLRTNQTLQIGFLFVFLFLFFSFVSFFFLKN